MEYLSVVNLWIDASYNTHEYCRGHIGVMMNLVRGDVLRLYTNQKLNVKGPT